MEYSKIVSVTGLPGLFELVTSKGDGAIVRSLDDNKARFVSARVHNFSHLESIEIYTLRENVNLVDIFHAMENAGTALPDAKDNTAVKKYFEKVFPDMDFERVYSSDMKKMVKWFEVLKNHDIEIKLSEPEEEPAEEVPVKNEPKEEKPVKKAAAKKEKDEAGEKPKKTTAKKAAPKKEEKEEAPKKAAKKK